MVSPQKLSAYRRHQLKTRLRSHTGSISQENRGASQKQHILTSLPKKTYNITKGDTSWKLRILTIKGKQQRSRGGGTKAHSPSCASCLHFTVGALSQLSGNSPGRRIHPVSRLRPQRVHSPAQAPHLDCWGSAKASSASSFLHGSLHTPCCPHRTAILGKWAPRLTKTTAQESHSVINSFFKYSTPIAEAWFKNKNKKSSDTSPRCHPLHFLQKGWVFQSIPCALHQIL